MAMSDLYFHPRAVPDAELVRLRKLTVESILPQSGELGQWLHAWIDTEQACRTTDPGSRPRRHLTALPPATEWSDRQLGLALKASTTLSYLTLDGSLSDFVDRVAVCLAEVAANRLANHE